MKVCTDSCLFGAWLADKIENKILHPESILDIGSGTGLLSLMLAQKSKASINAVEIDENSFQQAKENFNESKWSKQLQAFHADIKSWKAPVKYDLIISNPPFFENDLQSGNQNRNVAKHHEKLTLTELLVCISKHLNEEGFFAVLLPFRRLAFFKKMAALNNYYLFDELLVRQTQEHSFFRALLLFGTHEESTSSNELAIKKQQSSYSDRFNELLKDYYL